MEQTLLTNVAVNSTEGHFVKGAKVVCLDGVKETFFVKGEAALTTKNHQTLPLEENCLITPQQVYNPITKLMVKSRD